MMEAFNAVCLLCCALFIVFLCILSICIILAAEVISVIYDLSCRSCVCLILSASVLYSVVLWV